MPSSPHLSHQVTAPPPRTGGVTAPCPQGFPTTTKVSPTFFTFYTLQLIRFKNKYALYGRICTFFFLVACVGLLQPFCAKPQPAAVLLDGRADHFQTITSCLRQLSKVTPNGNWLSYTLETETKRTVGPTKVDIKCLVRSSY